MPSITVSAQVSLGVLVVGHQQLLGLARIHPLSILHLWWKLGNVIEEAWLQNINGHSSAMIAKLNSSVDQIFRYSATITAGTGPWQSLKRVISLESL